MKTLLAFILFALSSLTYVNATDNKTIRISTKDTDLILQVGENGRLYQTYLGEKLLHEQDLQHFQWCLLGNTPPVRTIKSAKR